MSLKSIKHNPFKVVEMFEEEVAEYTNAPYAIAVDSCTSAILLCCKYLNVEQVTIPKKTYLSVPQSVIHAGGTIKFEGKEWSGIYQLKPYPIYDAAKRFTSNMYMPGTYMCLSFHMKKLMPMGKGGMILTDNKDCLEWFRRMRYEGRGSVPYMNDNIELCGYNMYMTPMEAAYGLWFLMNYPEHMDDQIENNGLGYDDLTRFKLFQQ